MAADQQLDVVAATGPRVVDDVLDLRVRALERERRLVTSRHPADDLEVLRQDRHPLLEIGERVPERQGLARLEAGAEAEDKPAARDRVERRRGLGRHRRVAERRVDDREAELDPRHDRGDCGHDRDAVELDRLGVPLGEDVLAVPERIEAQPLAHPGDLEDPVPGVDRLPVLELVEVTLREQESDPHRGASLAGSGAVGEAAVAGRAPPWRCSGLPSTTSTKWHATA